MERLNSQDALQVYGEATGWPLHMGSLQVYDAANAPEGLDLERVRELYRQRLPLMPLFRKRLVKVPGGLDRPGWVEEPDVDVEAHVRGVRVPAPGTDRELAELVGRLYAPPVDLTGPVWEIWVVEGLQGGRVAIFVRLHHAAVDGVRGMEVQGATFDVDPHAPIGRAGSVPGPGTEVPSGSRLLGDAALRLAGTPVRAVRTAGRLVGAAGRLGELVRRHELPGLTLPFAAPRTSLNGRVSPRRALVFCSLPLGPVKAVARAEQVTVNDVVLALTGGAFARYLADRGELPRRSLTAGVPVGLPGDAPARGSGNRWQVMVTTLATDVTDPVARLHAIARSTRAGKALTRAVGADLWADAVDLPPVLVGAVAGGYARLGLTRLHPPIVNVTVSNVRGPGVPLYFAGARLEAMYPMGPIADGLGLNVTVIGYRDSLDFGLTVCPDLVADPWSLVVALRAESAALTGGPGPPRGGRRAAATGPAQRRARHGVG